MEYKGDTFYIKEVILGNSFAYKYLVERYKDRAFNLALRICGNREDAEEVAQDAFMKAFRSLKDFRMKSSFSTWLYRIVYNSAITRIRNRKSNILSLEEFPATYIDFKSPDISEVEADREYRNALINFALKKLPETERAVITLHYFEDLDIAEISDTTGLSKSNVKMKLFRARVKMLEILKDVEKKNLAYHGQE
jgi:RNA polymerase sigma factor (sigma-70 family)